MAVATPPTQQRPEHGASEPDDSMVRMSFGDHLDELRRRLLIAAASVVVAVMAMVPFKDAITGVYIGPYRTMWDALFEGHCTKMEERVTAAGGIENLGPLDREAVEFLRTYRDEIMTGAFERTELISVRGGFNVPYTLKAMGGLEDFWTFMAASILFGVILASPIVVYQIWAFIAAGLYVHERRAVTRYFPFGVTLLASGVAFGFLVVVPTGLEFLVRLMKAGQVEFMPSVSQYFSLLFTLTAALGVVFQLPLVMVAVQKVGLVSHATMRKQWRYIILGMFLLSAMLTPPEPVTQLMMAFPMVGLYCLGLVLTGIQAARKADTGAPTGGAA